MPPGDEGRTKIGVEMDNGNTESMLRIQEVLNVTGLSRSALYRLVERGEFPMGRKKGGWVVWAGPAVEAWVASQDPASGERAALDRRVDQAYQDGFQEASLESSRENGAFFSVMEKVGDRLRFLSDALDCVSNGPPRTTEWWEGYTRAAARELRELCKAMPSLCSGVAEFQPVDLHQQGSDG